MTGSPKHHKNGSPRNSRALTAATLLCLLCFFCCALVAGQRGRKPKQQELVMPTDPPDYVRMTFETKHRGAYNLSKCTQDLLNCWEIMPQDLVCTYFVRSKKWFSTFRETGNWDPFTFTTICDRMRVYCTDNGFDSDDYHHLFQIRDVECDFKEVYTRRRTSTRDDMMQLLPWSVPYATDLQLSEFKNKLRQ